MEGKSERCSWCGVQLLVPPETKSIQCSVCNGITRVRSNDRWVQVQDSISHTANRFKDLVNTVVSGSVNSYPAWNAQVYGYYPQLPPPRPSPPLTPPNPHGRKRALLCGVSYYGRSYKLKGSVNDVRCMRYFLVEKMGFPNESILILTEDETDPLRIPTKHNIRMALKWLVQGVQSGDSLVFHFSGHGSRERDKNMDEIDGYDETLCPVDYETQGKIIDDEVNDTIVRPIPRGAKLHAIIDACYSGTVLDLPFLCRMNREGVYTWEFQTYTPSVYKGTSGGLAISFGACDDQQTASDTTALAGKASTGALTYCFIQAVQTEPGLTYGRLLNSIRQQIREAKTGIRLNGPIASLINKVLGADLSQEPQLSSSEKFDIYSKQFLL
ncbi:metacaspase-1-like [Quercus lobata]|uniref:metacaspase-1-like n=1 Tax=Quercus lobata TaxID=97700 RepID=UPI001244A55F|nr:metacaspase-1-like [Quercus lobata]